ncbi:hypothetical protein [Plesiomonas shigelloides]|uniref:hypothetical protein n=1 Tax=Plesiomonas shigelloides TaxID=703 RepID=UPI00387EFA0D
MPIAIASILTLVTAVIYSLVVCFLQHEKLWDWFNTLVGSTISFFLAVLGGIFLLRLQTTAAEAADRKALRSLLTAEFSDLIRILSDSSRMDINLQSGMSRSVLIAFIQPLATEKAALSGLLPELESENLLHLARKLRMLNFKSEHLMGLIQSRAEEPFLVHAIDNIEQTRIAAVEGVRHIANQLGLTLNENYPD